MTDIRTSRLLLRPARKDDLADLHAVLADAQAMRYWSTPPHETLDQTAEWLAAMIAIPQHEGEDHVIEYQGRAIGKAGLYRFPEIGFILHPAFWGRGIAGEALRAILDRAFAVHHLMFVEADVDPRNAPSLQVLERLGFMRVGMRERSWLVGNEWCDSVDLRLRAEEWRETASRVAS